VAPVPTPLVAVERKPGRDEAERKQAKPYQAVQDGMGVWRGLAEGRYLTEQIRGEHERPYEEGAATEREHHSQLSPAQKDVPFSTGFHIPAKK
jgi:hypothetical protein